MPKLNKRPNKKRLFLLKFLGVVFSLSVLVSIIVFVQEPQFFQSSAKNKNAGCRMYGPKDCASNCSPSKSGGKSFKCRWAKGKCNDSTQVCVNTNNSKTTNLPSCAGTGNCGVRINSKTIGAINCINQYDNRTYWCCPAWQGEKDGVCTKF